MSTSPSPAQRARLEALERIQRIDEFGELERQVQQFWPVAARYEVVKKDLAAMAADEPADKPVVLQGNLYAVQLSPKRNERTVTKRKAVFALLKKALGMDGLIAIFDPPMSLIDKHLPKSQQAGLIIEERSGYRTMTVVARQAAQAPAA